LSGLPELNISVSNSGKRAISINHVLLQPPGHPGLTSIFCQPDKTALMSGKVEAVRFAQQAFLLNGARYKSFMA
jgi:hypothetical protein